MQQIPVSDVDAIGEGEIRAVETDVHRLILVRNGGRLFCVENRCGHFGVPLVKGKIEDDAIHCPMHGISFSLESGEVVNRPWENCNAIRVFPVEEEGGNATIQFTETL